MEDTPEKTATPLDEKTTTAANPGAENKEKKNVVSDRQRNHLTYAREMKRIKQAKKEYEAEKHNNTLSLINKRLTNIESRVEDMVDIVHQPIGGKRIRKPRRLPEESSEDLEAPPAKKTKKITETEKKIEKPISFLYDTLIPYAGKTLFVACSGIILSIMKQYATALRRDTTDGDRAYGAYYQNA